MTTNTVVIGISQTPAVAIAILWQIILLVYFHNLQNGDYDSNMALATVFCSGLSLIILTSAFLWLGGFVTTLSNRDIGRS